MSMKLEELSAGQSLSGIESSEIVTVVATAPFGVSAGRDLRGDLVEMQLHDRGVAAWQNVTGAAATGRHRLSVKSLLLQLSCNHFMTV
jgi:hypothetical protein